MILVDTSVLIGLLRGTDRNKTRLFHAVIEKGIPFGISVLTYQEVLQGAKDEREFLMLEQYLGLQRIYYLPADKEFYASASRLTCTLRRSGITPRNTIDILIAATAIKNNLYLLHDDKDFDSMENIISGLKVLHALPS